jgi:hypothetical protein
MMSAFAVIGIVIPQDHLADRRLNEMGDCDRTVIHGAQNFEEH